MSTPQERLKSYVGFAIKAGKAAFGLDNVQSARHVALLLVSDGLERSGKSKLAEYNDQKAIPVITLTAEQMLDCCARSGVKIIGICQKSLAAAIMEMFGVSKPIPVIASSESAPTDVEKVPVKSTQSRHKGKMPQSGNATKERIGTAQTRGERKPVRNAPTTNPQKGKPTANAARHNKPYNLTTNPQKGKNAASAVKSNKPYESTAKKTDSPTNSGFSGDKRLPPKAVADTTGTKKKTRR